EGLAHGGRERGHTREVGEHAAGRRLAEPEADALLRIGRVPALEMDRGLAGDGDGLDEEAARSPTRADDLVLATRLQRPPRDLLRESLEGPEQHVVLAEAAV